MKNFKKIGLPLALILALILLVNPGWNPLLGESSRAAVSAQLAQTFGGLFSGDATSIAQVISAAAVVVFVWLVCIVICAVLELMAKKGRHTRSMAGLFSSLTKFICAIVGLVWALSVLGVDLVGIFASLGIVSLIIGFGAQSLIEDAITGVFIIFEGQYHVGDIVVLDEFRGTVQNIGIRTTRIMDDGGNVKIVNNSDIRNIQNRSRADSVAVSDLSIAYECDIRQVEAIIAAELPGMFERHPDVFLECPQYKGVQAMGDSAVVLRFIVKATEANFYAAFRALNRELKLMCDKHGIEIPFNQLVVSQKQ
jgi:small conductance mechanosensitive channel